MEAIDGFVFGSIRQNIAKVLTRRSYLSPSAPPITAIRLKRHPTFPFPLAPMNFLTCLSAMGPVANSSLP